MKGEMDCEDYCLDCPISWDCESALEYQRIADAYKKYGGWDDIPSCINNQGEPQ